MVLFVLLEVVSGMREGKGECTQTRREFRSERMDAICIVKVVDMDLGSRWFQSFERPAVR